MFVFNVPPTAKVIWRQVTEMSLMKLQKEVKHSMKAAFAEGTTKNLEAQWKAYLLF